MYDHIKAEVFVVVVIVAVIVVIRDRVLLCSPERLETCGSPLLKHPKCWDYRLTTTIGVVLEVQRQSSPVPLLRHILLPSVLGRASASRVPTSIKTHQVPVLNFVSLPWKAAEPLATMLRGP